MNHSLLGLPHNDGAGPRRSARQGSISPKAIIAIVVFLAIMGALRYATLPAEEVQILEQKRVSVKFLSGQPVNLDKLRFKISMDSIEGTGIPTQMATMAAAAARSENPGSDDTDEDGKRGDDSRVIDIQPDPNGSLLMAKIRLSLDFLDKKGKVKSLEANISMPDIVLQRTSGDSGGSEAVYLASGLRDVTETAKGKAAQFNFGSGNVLVLPEPAPQTLWLAKGTVKQTQDLSNYVDVVCLFARPGGPGDLVYNIVGTQIPFPPIQ